MRGGAERSAVWMCEEDVTGGEEWHFSKNMADLPPDSDKAEENQPENREDQHGHSAAELPTDEAAEPESEPEPESERNGESATESRAEEPQSGASPPPVSPQPAANRDPEPPAQRPAADPTEEPAEQLQHTKTSRQSPADLDWSEGEEEEEPRLTPPSKLSTLTTEPDPQQEKSEDQHAEDAKCDAEKKQQLAQKEKEDFNDLSVEMECEEDDDYDDDDEEEEEKEEEEKKEEEKGEEEEEEEVVAEKEMEEEKEEETPEEEEGGGEPDGGDERKEAEVGGREEEECHEADGTVRQKKSHMECRDCGKTFTRRETYDLHRHVHMHQEEQASLTCKDCGLTFQHRSSLIKHRSEHQQNGVSPPALVSRRQVRQREFKEEMSIECDQCGDRFASVIRYRLHACQQSPEKLYRCPLCRKEFQYRVSINAHMQSHSLDSPYRCLECNKGFQCAVTLHIHQRSHAALKPYECPDCGMVFRHRSFMEDHRRKHTEERPHQCKICHKSFKYSSLLQQHQYLHTGQKPYRCSECGKRFAFAQNMRAHYRQHKKTPNFASAVAHTANCNVAQVAGLGTAGKENTNHEVEKQRNCPLCPRLFCKAADLREHMLIHEAEYEKLSNGKKNEPTYACPYCPLKFFDESVLQSHVLIHQVHQAPAPLKREVLSIAREDSTDNMSGGGEWGDQSDKKPLKCKECGKCFRYRSVLELHMRIHNKGYQCHICKKSFRFSSYLQQHLIIHSGKKPYKCPDCGKDFAFLQNMKTHQRLHQQKPFRCNQCRKGYSDESQLQRHMLSHTGEKPHKCHLCDKSFGLAYLLRDHLNTHTGERPHRCQECHKSFPWLSSLLVHQKIHARKRQALNQSYSSLAASRTRGVAGRARRNARWISSWPKMGEDVGRTMPLTQASFPDDVLQGSMLPNMIGQPSVSDQQSLLSWQMESKARPVHLQQQQWQIHIKPQQQPKWVSDGQQNDMKHHFMSGVHLKPILPKLAQPQNPTWADPTQENNGQEQKKQQQLAVWESSSTSAPKSPSNSGESSGDPRVHSPTSKTLKSTDATQNTKAELHSQSPKDKDENTDSDKTTKSGEDQGHPTDEPSSKPWTFRTPLEMPNTLNLQEKQQMQLVLHPPPQMQLLPQPLQQLQQEQLQQFLQQQQFHQSQQQQNHIPSAWEGTPQANQLGTISIQFGGPRFAAPGPGSAIWNFQATPVVSQTLINGPIQQGPVRSQQVPVVSGPPILVNKNPSFISPPLALPSALALPGPLPIPGPAPGIFFTPQGLPSPHLTQRTEPLKPGNQVLFGPDRRFCCMVCGCTLPGELELQMHYMQHAQGEI